MEKLNKDIVVKGLINGGISIGVGVVTYIGVKKISVKLLEKLDKKDK